MQIDFKIEIVLNQPNHHEDIMDSTIPITLSMPRSAWDTLKETLEMDIRSKAFDRNLRNEIAAALNQVVEILPAN
jgi:hypothetical protein